jgi:hypothetical protein
MLSRNYLYHSTLTLLSFLIRYLHAALPDLMEPGAFEKQIQFEKSEDPKEQKLLKRRHRRVTFLVNIWLNYQPYNVHPFPDATIDKLSGYKEDRTSLEFQSADATATKHVSTSSTTAKDLRRNSILADTPKEFTWPMGDCDSAETIKVCMPLATIRDTASIGGNVKIEWDGKACFGLHRGPTTETSKRTKDQEGDEGAKQARTE